MLRIGNLQLDFPVTQAALAGYSDAPMRLIARELGASYALHEVMLDTTVVRSGKIQRQLLSGIRPDDHPIGGQLMGAHPADFAAAAVRLVDNGYDVIDVNFGCPVKKVLGRHRGGYLLSDPPTAIEILRAVRDAVPPAVPMSVKLRRGMDDTPESTRKFYQIVDAAFELGVDAVTVHPRTVVQRYQGTADWRFLAEVKRYAGDRTVVGSGDLFAAEDVVRMMHDTGVDGVALARGCIGNPWLFADARAVLAGRPLPDPPSVPEQGRLIRKHFELSVAIRGADVAVKVLRKSGIKYAKMHPAPKKVRAAFVAAKNRAEWETVLDEWYDPNRNWPPGVRRHGPDIDDARDEDRCDA
jgi:tRNA-dihydrouridine synthase B